MKGNALSHSSFWSRHGWRALPVILSLAAPLAAAAFGFDDVAKRAQELSKAPYKPPVVQLPQELRDLGYDAYRDIRYRPERAIWRTEKLPFELQFFHLGSSFQLPVRINTVDSAGVKRLEFDASQFTYGDSKARSQKNAQPRLCWLSCAQRRQQAQLQR